MPLAVASVIRRHLRATEAFTAAHGDARPPRAVPVGDEPLVGWYVNPPPDDSEWVLFTERAIYVVAGANVRRIPLDEIVAYELPESKTAATDVVIDTRSGRDRIPMRGRHGPNGRFTDAWSLVQVLHVLVRK